PARPPDDDPAGVEFLSRVLPTTHGQTCRHNRRRAAGRVDVVPGHVSTVHRSGTTRCGRRRTIVPETVGPGLDHWLADGLGVSVIATPSLEDHVTSPPTARWRSWWIRSVTSIG